MKFWRRNWYYIGGILFVLLAFVMGLWECDHMGKLRIILIYSWMGMLMHQFEEYAFPGGFPMISNNPGLASTAFLQTPVAIYYIWYADYTEEFHEIQKLSILFKKLRHSFEIINVINGLLKLLILTIVACFDSRNEAFDYFVNLY